MTEKISFSRRHWLGESLLSKLFAAVCVCLLCLSVWTNASAAGWYVSDFAGLLDEDDADELEDRLAEISEEYACDLVVVTVDSCDGQDIQSYTDDFYEYNEYGQGSDNSGMMLLVDMDSRQFHMFPFGAAIDIFTDYGMQVIDDKITDALHEGDYAEAFETFADLGEQFMKEAQEGMPFDTNHPYKDQMALWLRLLISAGVGIAAAAIVVGVLFAQLKTVGHERRAILYAREGSFRLTRANDLFLYRTRTRRRIGVPTGMVTEAAGAIHTALQAEDGPEDIPGLFRTR